MKMMPMANRKLNRLRKMLKFYRKYLKDNFARTECKIQEQYTKE